jgi:hypothetical protein
MVHSWPANFLSTTLTGIQVEFSRGYTLLLAMNSKMAKEK